MGNGKRPGVTAVRKPAVTPPQCLPPTLLPVYSSDTYDRHIHTVHKPHAISPHIVHTQKTQTMPTRDTHKNTTRTNGDVTTSNNKVTDMYLLDNLGKLIIACTSNPFLTVPILHGLNGEQVCFLAVVDNGAMINVIDTAAFQRIAHRLDPLSPSS